MFLLLLQFNYNFKDSFLIVKILFIELNVLIQLNILLFLYIITQDFYEKYQNYFNLKHVQIMEILSQ